MDLSSSSCWRSYVPPVSHTYRDTADCHSHCFITPHLCLCLILLLLLLWAPRLPQTLEGVIQLQTADTVFWVTRLELLVRGSQTTYFYFRHISVIQNALLLLEFTSVSTLQTDIFYIPTIICLSPHVSAIFFTLTTSSQHSPITL